MSALEVPLVFDNSLSDRCLFTICEEAKEAGRFSADMLNGGALVYSVLAGDFDIRLR